MRLLLYRMSTMPSTTVSAHTRTTVGTFCFALRGILHSCNSGILEKMIDWHDTGSLAYRSRAPKRESFASLVLALSCCSEGRCTIELCTYMLLVLCFATQAPCVCLGREGLARRGRGRPFGYHDVIRTGCRVVSSYYCCTVLYAPYDVLSAQLFVT